MNPVRLPNRYPLEGGHVIDQNAHVRIARPSKNLAAVERFYVDGLGLSVVWRTSASGAPGEHDLIMLGWPGAGWHFELVYDESNPIEPTPTVEDLFVIYVNGTLDEGLVERLVAAGGKRVEAHNPYWDRWGVTIEDPDGYRLVLCERSWSNA